jgi:D-3-phosphoglycerate dehydrogenase
MHDAEILIVRSTRVTAEAISAAPSLRLIVRAGADISTIDVNTASANGIYVANCPGKNAHAVAELVVGLLVALDRRILDAAQALREGSWSKRTFGQARGLNGLTLGLMGFGATGQAVANAARVLGMNIIVWSRSLTPQHATAVGVGYCDTALELARRSDAISIHLAANAETYHLVNRRFLQNMRDGAYLVNTARGEIIDTAALKNAIRLKGLRVALDVFEHEPGNDHQPFTDRDLAGMVLGTPHIGASTRQAADAVAREVVRVVGSYIGSGVPVNAINAPRSLAQAFAEDEAEYAF